MNNRTIVAITILIGALGFTPIIANAECAANSVGTVYCSKYTNGGATTNGVGTVVCGRGQCRRNSVGSVKCSRVEGGGAAVNSVGMVKCVGGCEPGQNIMCARGE